MYRLKYPAAALALLFLSLSCPACGKAVPRRELVGHRYVCPLCGHHYPVGAYYRLSLILDKGTFRELDAPLASNNPLDFPGYEAKLDGARRRTGMNEAVVTAAGRIGGQRVAVGALDSRFFGEESCRRILMGHFKVGALVGLGLEDYATGIIAAGAVMQYIYETQKSTLEHITTITPYSTGQYMVIDTSTRRNLELV